MLEGGWWLKGGSEMRDQERLSSIHDASLGSRGVQRGSPASEVVKHPCRKSDFRQSARLPETLELVCRGPCRQMGPEIESGICVC
jgi:hypothetical protein